MKVANIEIPSKHEKDRVYRALEMLPALLSYLLILAPIVLSIVNTAWAAYFLIAYVLVWFFKAVAMSYRVVQGYRRLNVARALDWTEFLEDLDRPEAAIDRLADTSERFEAIHRQNLLSYVAQKGQSRISPNDILHVALVAAYNESIDVLEPTIHSVSDSVGDQKKHMVLVIAYEERGGPEIEKTVKLLLKKYGGLFRHAMAVKHPPDIEGEVVGKGGNITYAARVLKDWLDTKEIAYENVLVTTLDADNRPDPNYFQALTYSYIVANDRKHKSFQPIPMYFTNIWDVPAPMRIIATGNSIWMMVTATRPHLLRNFSAHAQPMSALVEMDYWSVRTIVEDGHQFWRSYFRYDGNYEVLPVYIPVHQDAVLSSSYFKTLKAQFIQLRRWAYGASDIAYVAHKGYFTKNNVPRLDLFLKFVRLIEGHVSWATAAILVTLAGWIPILFNPEASTNLVAQQLPELVASLQRVATVGILVTMYIGIVSLPPRPSRVKRRVSLLMYIQWILLPITTILYNTFAAINSQTRLLLGLYLENFDVTDKSVKK